jgi:fucose permease
MPPRTKTQLRMLTASLGLALGLALFVMGLDAGVVNVILPELQSVFETTVSRAMMLATDYMTAMAAFGVSFAGPDHLQHGATCSSWPQKAVKGCSRP